MSLYVELSNYITPALFNVYYIAGDTNEIYRHFHHGPVSWQKNRIFKRLRMAIPFDHIKSHRVLSKKEYPLMLGCEYTTNLLRDLLHG